MKYFVLVLISIFVLDTAQGRDREQERLALQKLVKEREQQFGEYARAAGTRSGIFGNRTRRDLQEQVDVLTEIIKTDNRIISTLNSFLSYRTFERTQMSYSQAEIDEKNRRLDELTTSLSKQLKESVKAQKRLELRMKWSRLLNFILLGLAIYLGYKLWKEKGKTDLRHQPD